MPALLEFRIKNLEYALLSGVRIKGFFAYLFIIIALFLILFALFSPSVAFAQGATQSATPSATLPSTYYPLPPTVSPTSPIYTDLIVHNMFHTFSCLTVGGSIIGQPCLTYQLQKDAQGAIQSVPVLSQINLSGGLLGTTGSLLAALYMNPPVRTADYLASLGQGLGIVKEAHAQGVFGSGQAVLSPVLALWQVSRNIAYLAMIIIFVIIGLMVMFRQRINPQTVITAQAALPGLVIGLILITFSYFFAALLTDTAFIGTNILGYYFSAAQPPTTTPPPPLAEKAAAENVLSIMSKFLNGIDKGQFSGIVEDVYRNLEEPALGFVKTGAALIAYQYGSFVGPAIGSVVGGATCLLAPDASLLTKLGAPLCAAIGQAFGSVATGTIGAAAVTIAPGPVIGTAIWAIFMAIILYTMFRLLLRLINNFLSIIFLVISAPFHFLAASIPGRQGIATAWILNMLCNVLAFPAVMGVFYFIAFILGQGENAKQPFNITTPLGIDGYQTLPLLGGFDISFIGILLAFGALIATPAIPDIICRTIGRVGVAGQLIGQEVSGGVRGGQGQFSQAQSRLGGIGGNISSAVTQYRGPRAPGLGERIKEQVAKGYKVQGGLTKT